MESCYLVRYGFMGEVGRFSGPSNDFERGQGVVIRSHRGIELGEILVEVTTRVDSEAFPADSPTSVLRVATPDDRERAGRAVEERARYFQVCQQVLGDADWPIDLIDVEPLLEERRIVLHYLGPHHLELKDLLAVFRNEHELEVMFSAVGLDVPAEEAHAEEAGGCGSGGCGSGGGCGTGGCGSAEGSGAAKAGCASCGIKELLSRTQGAAPR